MPFGQGVDTLRVREIDARDVPAEMVAAWSNLETRALEPNAYLSPHFVLPAVRHLDPERPVLLLAVEDPGGNADGSPRLLGVLPCHMVPGTRGFPTPHLVAYRSRHCFLTGFLLDREQAGDALAALLDHVERRRGQWHGIELDMTWGDGRTFDLLTEISGRRKLESGVWNESQRAVLQPRSDEARIRAVETAESHSLRRRVRRLQELGQACWNVVCRGGVRETSVEAFLDLEHRGWKGDHCSSLRSTPAHERFFREMVAGFSGEDRAVFVELQLDGKVVATTSNFISGQAGFAFKVGWLPDLAKVSPARLTELELVRQLYSHDVLGRLDFLDSGAAEGSYVDELWPGRRPLVTLGVGCTTVGRAALGAVRTARAMRRRLRRSSLGILARF